MGFNGATSSSTWKAKKQEMSRTPCSSVCSPLQWGHVVVDVEGRPRVQADRSERDRFNGATSSSTWKASVAHGWGEGVGKLQWGHVVVDVEGARAVSRTRGPCRGFNGATSSSTWKGMRSGSRRHLASLASMGPRRRRRGRHRAPRPASTPTRGFNGATSSSTWKGRRRRPASRRCHPLQWGHVVVDVEGWSTTCGA